MDLSSKHLRAYGTVADQWGIDPLLDRVVPLLTSIRSYTEYTVQQDERGAPDLISFRAYGIQDLWWHLMVYNGIVLYKEIVEGLVLRIPEYASIISIMSISELSVKNPKIVRV